MKKLMSTFKYISILILALSFVGCEEDDVVLPQVEAGFTYTLNVDTGTVTFINISENGDNYEWDLGDGTSTTLINPVNTYANGTYTIVLEAKNVSGASDTFQDTIIIEIPEVIALPITFDNEKVSYDAAVFNGTAFNILANPALGGTNNVASKVGEIINSGATFEGIAFELGEDLNLSTDKSVKMNFWSETPVDVLLKLEITETDAVEAIVSHSGSGWEELTFSFNSSKSYPKVVIFVDGPGMTSGTFYIDDIIQVETPEPLCIVETEENIDPANGDINWTFQTNDMAHTFEAFGNTSGEIVDNPLAEGINRSCSVEKFTKTGGCETFAGLGSELATALDFTQPSTNKLFKMKVLAETQVTEVTLRLERLPFPDVDPAVDRVATITQVGEWQELTFDFSDVNTGTYKSMIIYFERNANCDGDVYYFDDIIQVPGTGGSGGGTGGAFDSGLLTNGDFEDGGTAWIGNALNVQTEGGNSFTFANVMTAGDAFAVNLSQVVPIIQGSTYTLTFDASSDGNRTLIAGIGLNEAPFSNDVEVVNLTTTTQTFVLELTATDFGIANSRVLFDMGAATGVVVIDNVSLTCSDCDGGGNTSGGGGTVSGLVINGDFETGQESPWLVFQNGGTAGLDNTMNNGGSWSGKLATNGPSNPAFKQERIGEGVVVAGDTITISFDHIGANEGEGGVFNVILFVEGTGGAVPITHIFSPAPVLTSNWTSFSQSFTIPGGIDTSGGISFLIETVCGGASGCSVIANIDNVSAVIN